MRRISCSPCGSRIFSEEALDRTYHFKWRSIRNLLYLIFTYVGHPFCILLFNNMADPPVNIFYYTLASLVIGMTYMCADLFIKQYTRRIDGDQYLCPILKDVTIILVLQSTLFCTLSLRYAGDSARYLVSSFAVNPIWSVCSSPQNNSSICLTSSDILQHCGNPSPKKLISLDVTSAHVHYMEYMQSNVKDAWTWRFFVTAVIWILNFCLTTVPDSVMIKIYKHAAYLRHICSLFTFGYVALNSKNTKEAFYQLMNYNDRCTVSESISYAALVYGVGLIGVYDFGSVSPYNMVDNTLLIFTILFILLCALRSMTMYILILGLRSCIDINTTQTSSSHYMLFVVMPLSTEFLYGQKIINIVIFLYVLLSLFPCLMLYTCTHTRLFQSKFPSIKSIYIQGLICLIGFCFAIPMLLVDQYLESVRHGLIQGLDAVVLYMGGIRMAIIMWLYGVTKFSTDIHFWLGYTPTKFWIVCWAALPLLLLVTSGYKIYKLTLVENDLEKTSAFVWFGVSVGLGLLLQIRRIVRYVSHNNLMAAFRSSKKYGPFDKRDRYRRRKYDPVVDNRQCFHDCMPMDEEIDCNHMLLMNARQGIDRDGSGASQTPLTKMYENEPLGEESIVHFFNTKPDT